MASIQIDMTDRDTKRWMVCLTSMVRELEGIPAAKEAMDKFKAEVIMGSHPSLGIMFPDGYKVDQELI